MNKKQVPVQGHPRQNKKNPNKPVTYVEAHIRNIETKPKTPSSYKSNPSALHAVASGDETGQTVEKLDQEKLRAARWRIGKDYRYYNRLLYRMPIIETHSTETFAVDKYGRIYINPTYANKLSQDHYVSHLIHEFNHFIRNHATRFEGKKSFKSNLAGDCEINDDIAASKDLVEYPHWIFPDRTFGLPTGRLAEEYYDTIPTEEIVCEDCGRKKTRYLTVEGQKKKEEEEIRAKAEAHAQARQAQIDAQAAAAAAAAQPKKRATRQKAMSAVSSENFSTTIVGIIPARGQCPTCGEGGETREGKGGDTGGGETGRGDGGPGGDDTGGMPDYIDDQEKSSCGGGSGSGGDPIEGEIGKPKDDDDGISENEADRIRGEIARDIISMGKDRSDIPGGLYKWADSFLKPKVDWQKHLKRELRRAIFRAGGGAKSTWDKPSRRNQIGRENRVLKPGYHSPKVRVAIVVDTSASMSGDDIAQALGEVQGILKTAAIEDGNVTVLTVSTRVAECKKVTSASQIEVMERGGTDMRVGIEHAEQLPQRPHVTVVLTDGETPWPNKAPKDMHVIAGVIGSSETIAQAQSRFGIPKFIKSVPIPTS